MPSESVSEAPKRRPIIRPRTGARNRGAESGPRRNPARSVQPTISSDQESATTASMLRSALSVVTAVGTPLTMITALMLYFGWARSNAQSAWMGIDVSLFHFSAQDYVLRSVRALFVPLLVGCTVGIGWLELHRRIAASVDRTGSRRALRIAGRTTMFVGLGAAIVGVVLAALKLLWPPGPVVFPLLMAAGTALAAYGRHLISLGTELRESDTPSPRWQTALLKVLVGVVIAMAVFWAVGEYAGIVGRGIADAAERKPSSLPTATAISESPLGIDAPNVITTPIAVGPKTLYRTTGLRLLGESGGRLFLINDGWNRAHGRIMVLDNDKSVRWEFGR